MIRIGLLLRVEPASGGAFQYSQAILDAVASLPREKFAVIIGYTSRLWEKYLCAYDIEKMFIPAGMWGSKFGKTTSFLLSGRLWRKACIYFHPVAEKLLSQNCDLWIFPAQDAWSYQIPVPALVTIFDLMHRYERSFPEVSVRGEFYRRELHYQRICRLAKGVLVDSELGKQHVKESYGLTPEKIFSLPYIAPTYLHTQSTTEDFNSRYNLPDKYIFYPAQFWNHKNHENLIRAIATLKSTIPDLKLVLAGSKKNGYVPILELVRDLNLVSDIIFLGYVPDEDMAELYKRARALVMPTYFGPTNIPPLEAFTVGCPVAVSNVYAMPEQVGTAALLFNPSSVPEIAECIERLWVDDVLCSRLVSEGSELIRNYKQKHFNAKLMRVIEHLVA